MDISRGTAIAAAVAGMLFMGCGSDSDDGDDPGKATEGLKCQGGNECAGMSECASPEGKNECQGMNECAGMGWVTVDTEKECTDRGGTIAKADG